MAERDGADPTLDLGVEISRRDGKAERDRLPDILGIRVESRALTGVALLAPPEIQAQDGHGHEEGESAYGPTDYGPYVVRLVFAAGIRGCTLLDVGS